MAPAGTGTAVSGAQLPGVGWVDATTIANLLATLPMDVARAVLDADTGTLASPDHHRLPATRRPSPTSSGPVTAPAGCGAAPAPPNAATSTTPDPGPTAPPPPPSSQALCRRHHRFKQTGRWRPTLDPDGTLTWHGPDGATRTTEPQHRLPV